MQVTPCGIFTLIKEVQPENFDLAHMGNAGFLADTVKYLAGAPVYMDLAYSMIFAGFSTTNAILKTLHPSETFDMR